MCCALIFMCSPIRAAAVIIDTVAAIYIGVVAGVVILSIMQGLGVGMGQQANDINDFVTQCAADMAAFTDFVKDGTVQVMQYMAEGNVLQHAASVEMVEWVRQWLFDNEIVSDVVIPDGFASYNGVILPHINMTFNPDTTYPYRVIFFYSNYGNDECYYYLRTMNEMKVNSSGSYNTTKYGGDQYSYSTGDSWKSVTSASSFGFPSSFYTLVYSNYDFYDTSGNLVLGASQPVTSGITSDYDVSIGEIANPDIDLESGYAAWADGAIIDGDEMYYPLGMGATYEDTLNLSQTDIWSGVGYYEIMTVNCSFASDSDDGEVYLGSTVQLLASVVGTGSCPQNVTWSWFAGGTPLSSATTLTEDGVLSVGLDETATFLTVQATSVSDPTKFGTATIHLTLTEAPAIPGTDTDVDTFIGSLVDSIAGIFTDSKIEAITQGNIAVNDTIALIPDESGAFITAFDCLVDVCSYEGTSAVIEFPGITVPSVGGLFPAAVLLEPEDVDLEKFVLLMPEDIMAIINALFDCAVVCYCLKELLELIGAAVNGFNGIRGVKED